MLWKRMLLVGGLVAVVSLAAIDVRATYGARISVDEPQYLLTALSLAEDGDLDISDELSEERYRDFHETELLQQTIQFDESGRRVSPHDPLLPVLLAGPMKLGGWPAARGVMAAFAGLAASLTLFLAEQRYGVSKAVSATVVVGFFASPPLVAFGNQVYPAMPATVCILAGVIAVTGDVQKYWWVTALAVVALPWLAVKYVPLAAVLAVALLWQTRSTRRVVSQVVISLVAMGAAYLWLHQLIYGGWTVYAAGDHFVDGEWQVVGSNINVLGRTRRLVGLFVDRGFGLAAWAPGFLVGPAALVWMARKRLDGWVLLVSLVVVSWAVATWVALTMHGWWWPGRQVVPVLPIMVVAIAAAVDGSRRKLMAIAAASAIAFFGWLWLVVEASTRRRTLVVDFRDTSNPVYRAWKHVLPDHQSFQLESPALTMVWTALLIGSCIAVWFRMPKTGDTPT